VPVGAVIAAELVDEGADTAVFTELWGGFVLVGPDLVCVAESGPLADLLSSLREALGESLSGLPDVLAMFPDGRVVMREAKSIASKDRLGQSQHEFARTVQRLFGKQLDLAVVEWGAPRLVRRPCRIPILKCS
jgi:hypothetical protein